MRVAIGDTLKAGRTFLFDIKTCVSLYLPEFLLERAAMQGPRMLLSLFVLLLLVGCAATQQVVNKEAHPQLDFLNEGVTTKEDVLLKLGIPAAQFEGERILIYRLRERQKEGLVVIPPELGYRDARLAPVRSSWGR